ncbi:hypothetical protein F5880DRAFT_1508344 [Lentinula raphanica]|nr:hypothetical protein F5880DRAFT_1508344 [Lentinula raphanica]
MQRSKLIFLIIARLRGKTAQHRASLLAAADVEDDTNVDSNSMSDILNVPIEFTNQLDDTIGWYWKYQETYHGCRLSMQADTQDFEDRTNASGTTSMSNSVTGCQFFVFYAVTNIRNTYCDCCIGVCYYAEYKQLAFAQFTVMTIFSEMACWKSKGTDKASVVQVVDVNHKTCKYQSRTKYEVGSIPQADKYMTSEEYGKVDKYSTETSIIRVGSLGARVKKVYK